MGELKSGKLPLIQPVDVEETREYMRKNKSFELKSKVMSEHEAVDRFVDSNSYIGVELYGTVRCPMSIVREIVRQGKNHLSFSGQGILENDLLIAAGLIDRIDLTYYGYEVFGISKILRRAAEKEKKIEIVEWSNAALSWRFKAAAMGVPYIPVRSMLGTDTFEYSAAKEVECPFTGQKLLALPALFLDTVAIHVHRCDEFGNAQIDGIQGYAFEIARAAKKLIISTEEIIPTEEIRKYPERTLIPWFLVDAVVHAPYGSLPGEMPFTHWRDEEHLNKYFEMANSVEGIKKYMDEYVYGCKNHEEYLEKIGGEKKLAVIREQALKR